MKKFLLSCRAYHRFRSIPPRLVFADSHDGKTGGEKDGQHGENAEKDHQKADENKIKTVTLENARGVAEELSKKKTISESDKAKAFKILSSGDEGQRQKLLKFLQNAIDGKLNQSEWKSFLAETEEKTAHDPDEDRQDRKKKEKDEDDLKFDIKSKISAQTGEAVETSKKSQAAAAAQDPKNKELAAEISSFKSCFENLNYRARENELPVQDKLKEMVKDKNISADLAQKLYAVNFLEDNAGDEWEKLIRDIKDPKARAAVDHLHELKRREADNYKKIDREFNEKRRRFAEINNKIGADMMLKAARARSLEVLGGASGLPLKAGQVLVYDEMELNEQKKQVNKHKRATIKEIRFDDIEIKDENGNIKEKKPSSDPTIVIESMDPETRKFTTNPMSSMDFQRWAENQDVTEDIRDQKDLEKSIGHELKKGDRFEFREILSVVDQVRSTQDTVVEIKNINPEGKLIELDQKVLTRPGSGVRADVLSFGQFARWFKRNEVVRPIESLKKLQTELRAHNEALNTLYERDPAEYPAIEGKVGEILYFDDNSGTDFVIREIDDKKVVVGNRTPKGLTFTPAAFLRWVKKNEVEKRTPEAEALKASRNLSGEELAKAKEETQKKIEQQDIERQKEEPPPESTLGEEAVTPAEERTTEPKTMYRPEERAAPSVSYWRNLWQGTTLASLSDFWEIGKKGVEFFTHKFERWQKGKVGIIGQRMFGWYMELGAEFKSHAQSAENEVVNHHVEIYRTMGIDHVKEELIDTQNKDVMKAAITVLCEKGLMRWDDPAFQENIDRISGNIPKSVRASKDYIEALGKVIDGLWGPDTFREFSQKQSSSYNSIKGNFKDNAKRLENDPLQNGGLRGALQNLLYKHMHGEYVNPMEYEEYLDFAIENGKLTFGDKVFFLIMGVAAESPGIHGHAGSTLLHIDRVASIEGDRLNNFPMLDFFTRSHQDVDKDGNLLWEKDKEGKVVPRMVSSPNINHFRKWMHEICEKDMPGGSFAKVANYKELKFGQNITDYIENKMVWHEATRQRMEKASPDVTRMDHDDMHYFVVMMSEELVEQIAKKAGGARQQMSNEGLKNAFAGLNHFITVKMKSMRQHLENSKKGNPVAADAAKKDLRDLLNIMRTFIRLDSIVDRRAYHGSDAYTRFSRQELETPPVNDASRDVKLHIQEVRTFLGDLAKEYHLEKEFDVLMDKNIPENLRTEQQRMMMQFGNMLEGKMSRHKNPEEILNVFEKIQENNKKHDNEVKGIIEKLQSKTKIDQIAEQRYTLSPYRLEEFNSKLKNILTYKKQLEQLAPQAANPETVATQRLDRLQAIIKQLQAGNYEFEEGDDKLLDQEVDRLRRQVDGLQGKFDTAFQQLLGKAANDNAVPAQAAPTKKAA